MLIGGKPGDHGCVSFGIILGEHFLRWVLTMAWLEKDGRSFKVKLAMDRLLPQVVLRFLLLFVGKLRYV